MANWIIEFDSNERTKNYLAKHYVFICFNGMLHLFFFVNRKIQSAPFHLMIVTIYQTIPIRVHLLWSLITWFNILSQSVMKSTEKKHNIHKNSLFFLLIDVSRKTSKCQFTWHKIRIMKLRSLYKIFQQYSHFSRHFISKHKDKIIFSRVWFRLSMPFVFCELVQQDNP